MTGWDTLNCANHPERIAIERCEVCGKPLCAYCLYYTEDGQRLCEEHAERARLSGLAVEEPGAYADQLIGAQAGMVRKRKREVDRQDDDLYRGNSTDLLALLGLVITVVAFGACCGISPCLPLVGLVLSLIAVINAKHAHDPRRTRRLGIIGLLVSGAWVLAVAGCIFFYGFSLQRLMVVSPMTNWQSGATSAPVSASPTPTETPTPTDAGPGSAAYLVPPGE